MRIHTLRTPAPNVGCWPLKILTETSAVMATLVLGAFLGTEAVVAQSPVMVETLSSELPGGSGGLSVDAAGRIYVADFGEMLNGSGAPGTRVFVVEPDGSSSVYAEGFVGASGNELGPDGVLYQSNIGGSFISKVYPDGRNERWVSEGIRSPVGIATHPSGDLLVANCGNNSIRRVTLNGASTEFLASDLLACPNGITVGEDGSVYVANFGNGNVVRITDEGVASVLTSIPGNNNGHLVFFDGYLYVVARSAHQIYKVSLDGTFELLAGSGKQGLDDGPGPEATFSYPNDIGVSPDGRYLYVNDVADLSSTGVLLAPMVLRRIRVRE
jgi:sugar lactone lactonase YvrE